MIQKVQQKGHAAVGNIQYTNFSFNRLAASPTHLFVSGISSTCTTIVDKS